MDKKAVEDALEKIRPQLQADGGNVELVDITDDNIVKVRLTGACHGCPMAQMTLQAGVAQAIKQAAPDVEGVEAVQD